jgi:aryl-alcohol dehydrogenase-like predicted oxidoreductase
MRLTGQGIWGDPPDRAKATAVLRRAVELGVNLIDTADPTARGEREDHRRGAPPYPVGLVIATKGGSPGAARGSGTGTAAPRICEGVRGKPAPAPLDRIDIYQLHAVDPAVPMEDSLGS